MTSITFSAHTFRFDRESSGKTVTEKVVKIDYIYLSYRVTEMAV
jgi:hypothetical protein